MTLQAVVGGLDGVLIGTDTKGTTFPSGMLLREGERHALEFGKTQSSESGVEKILFNKVKSIALVCSGTDLICRVAKMVAENLEAAWDQYFEPIENLLRDAWTEFSESERKASVEQPENALILVHSRKPSVFKVRFKLGSLETMPFHRDQSQKLVVLGGDHINPAGMWLERFLPHKPPSINKLALLVAHYILAGGELNPAVIGGLRLYFSRNGDPFECLTEEATGKLIELSERLDKRTQKALLQPINF